MDQTYTLEQFAEMFWVNKHTVSRWLSIGIIKGTQSNDNGWLIPKSEIKTASLNVRYLKTSPLVFD
ncbi:MAG: helix-turn-helix domain-containing protein [Bacteroidales bacterium]|nr:helix-turn-helix domain-containing protein [Bacteroidales bacterium]